MRARTFLERNVLALSKELPQRKQKIKTVWVLKG